MDRHSHIQDAIGESEVFLDYQRLLGKAARVDRPVLIIGERGTGKELAASRLHYLSNRWNAPFIALNCAALPSGLIESELFGHEAGSFTGAAGRRKGRFEEADGGTLFLDEIGLIPIEVQEKILRTVEYGAFQRVGSSQTIKTDVRIVGATNQDLPKLCAEGVFKSDLLDRLSFEVLFVPPLRMRDKDILLLAGHFASRMAQELKRSSTPFFTESVKKIITSYVWPGNIRELKNTIERAVYRSEDDQINRIILNPFRNPWSETPSLEIQENKADEVEIKPWPRNIRDAVENMEINWLKEAMSEAGDHQGKAAELLGLNYNQFRGLYRKYQSML